MSERVCVCVCVCVCVLSHKGSVLLCLLSTFLIVNFGLLMQDGNAKMHINSKNVQKKQNKNKKNTLCWNLGIFLPHKAFQKPHMTIPQQRI